MTAATLEQPAVDQIAVDYEQVIETAIAAHPRSLQKRIGPSEIGIDCERRILHKLAGDPEPDRGIAWKPALGTAMHEELQRFFDTDNARYDPMVRWLTEQEVTVGAIGTTKITGSCDLFDTFNEVVYDHKVVGNSTLSKYRLHGPSQQYRIQANLYGLGWANEGWHPREVAICFLPREAEWSKRYIWHEPWHREVAEAALLRANQLQALLDTIGLEPALALYGPCDFPFCPWCASEQRAARKAQATSLFDT